MDKLQEQINEAIKNNLPKQLGESLQKRFKELELVEKKHDSAVKEIDALSKMVKDRDSTIEELMELKHSTEYVDKKTDEIEQHERNKKVFEAELKMVESDKRASEIAGFVGMVFKSPVFRKTVNENPYGMEHYNSGGGTTLMQGKSTVEETNIE